MKGNKNNNKFKIKTNAVNMPAGLFVLHSLVAFYAGYEFCKHTVLKDVCDTIKDAETYEIAYYHYDTAEEAEKVLSMLQDICNDYGYVSVADYYDIIDHPTQFIDTKYGWKDLRPAEIKHVQEGDYYRLKFPPLRRMPH